jgi:hypothetical protein
MRKMMTAAGVTALVFLTGCATAMAPAASGDTAPPAPPTGSVSSTIPSSALHVELKQMESSKWDAASAADRAGFMALFADDFVSVEYGSDVHGGVHRKTRADVFSGPPMPPSRFELSDWHFIQADGDVVVVSYRVKGLSFPWEAYATSVWARRAGRWQTVFYQASSATEPQKN